MSATLSQSVWLPTDPATDFPTLREVTSADVAVIGAGISGLTAAVLLAQEGLNVVVLEANRVGYGVTGYSTAKLTSLHRLIYARLEESLGANTAAVYAAANQAGIEQVASLVDSLGIDCDFERQSAYTYTCQAEQLDQLHREVEAAQRAGLAASFTAEVDLPLPVRGAVRLDGQAQFDPYRYCVGLARALVELGGRIFESTRVTNIRDRDPCQVIAAQGEVEAKHVVLATLLPILDRGGFFGWTHPSRSYGIAATLDGEVPTGMYISVEPPVRSVRSLADRRRIIVVGEGHKVGQDPDTAARYAVLEDWARATFPVSSITHRWSAQDYISADGMPYIGRMPLASRRIGVVTGLNKWGLAIGATAGRMLTDLVQGRDHPWASVFAADRANLTASFKTLAVENVDVAKRFVGDRAKSLLAPSIDDLPPGTGAIVKLDGKRVAAYRDEQGQVHAVSPVCTHLGCFVQWNNAERSWDCPCHGSRFDYEGRVLQGPAVRDLTRISPV